MTRSSARTVSVALMILVSAGCSRQPQSDVTAVIGATVIDGTGQPPVADAVILIDGNRIVDVGISETMDIPAAADVLDAGGLWVIPGMIDVHAHFWESARPGGQPTFVANLEAVFPYPEEIEWMCRRIPYTLSRYICAGVTSVVPLGAIPWEYEVRDLAGEVAVSPRVLLAGGIVANFPPTMIYPEGWGPEPLGSWLERPSDAQPLIAEYTERGVQLIKAGFINLPQYPLAEFEPKLRQLVTEAHAQGLPVSVHATGLASAKAAIRAGADVLAHTVAGTLDEEYLELATSGGVIHTSSIGVGEGHARLTEGFVLSEEEVRCADPEVIAAWERWEALAPERRPTLRQGDWRPARERRLRNLGQLHSAGIRIAVGSDGGNVGSMHGASFQRELVLLAEAGLSPRDILVAATRHGAEAIGRADDLGTIEAGKLADLVFLAADPTVSVHNLLQVTRVMVDGRIIEPSGWGDG